MTPAQDRRSHAAEMGRPDRAAVRSARVAVQRPFLGVALSAVPVAQDSVQRHAVSRHGRGSRGGGPRNAPASKSTAMLAELQSRADDERDDLCDRRLQRAVAARLDRGGPRRRSLPAGRRWPTVGAVYAAGFRRRLSRRCIPIPSRRPATPGRRSRPRTIPTTITTASISCWSMATAATVEQAEVVGEDDQHADIVVAPVPVGPSRRRGDRRAAVTPSPRFMQSLPPRRRAAMHGRACAAATREMRS